MRDVSDDATVVFMTNEQSMTTTTEPFSVWAARQPIRTTRMNNFVRDVLDGDEERMVIVTQRVTPFGIFLAGMEVA